MATDFYAFGEILWDVFPTARHAGGAPFNVAAHLAQIGASVSIFSAIGQDRAGDEILELADGKGIDTQFVARARTGLATGIVNVTLDARSNASYEIVQPAAWDEISVPAQAIEDTVRGRALLFGSLAMRSSHNLVQLELLLKTAGLLKFFDVNLRPPFVDAALVLELARRADVLKLNDEELGQLAGWVRTGEMTRSVPPDPDAVAAACAILGASTGVGRICVTRAAEGAVLWEPGAFVSVRSPKTDVRDTVGAGDAFMAGLMFGLTHGAAPQKTLEAACLLGSYVASQNGAIPALTPNVLRGFTTMLSL